MSTRVYPVIRCFVFCILILLQACIPNQDTGEAVEKSTKPSLQAESNLLELIRLDGSRMVFTLAEIQAMPASQVVVDGKIEQGWALLDILSVAEVTKYNSITFVGSGRSLELLPDQVGKDVLLSLTNRSTLKLISPAIPKANWVVDVKKIRVE